MNERFNKLPRKTKYMQLLLTLDKTYVQKIVDLDFNQFLIKL